MGFSTPEDYYVGELPRSGGDQTEYLGTAIFDGDKMVGELNGDETRVMLMAKGKFERAFIPIQDPIEQDKPETFDVRQQKAPVIRVTFKNEKPVINLKIFLEGDLIALRSAINYESEEKKIILEKKFEDTIKEQFDKTINQFKSLNSDVFSFGKKAVMHFSTKQEWEIYNWHSHFKEAEINTDVEFIIRRTGTMVRTNGVSSSEKQK